MKIGLIPIDNRPVCYSLPKLISEIDTSLELILPPREYLGDLANSANKNKIFDWLKSLENIDALIVSLDTIAYGGLVNSRRCPETYDEIFTQLNRWKPLFAKQKTYAFSSIMRISNNNINEEEKPYWDKWGKKIFDYSWHSHKNNCESCIMNVIPASILDDYLATRKRNFDINKIYLKWQEEKIFNTLIFSKDDCAEYGFNVQEANALKTMGAIIKTGADEIPMTLLARAINGNYKICPIYTEPNHSHLISNYEDISVAECLKNQIELAGCTLEISPSADIHLIVNNFINNQGEIVMKKPTQLFSNKLVTPKQFYYIADIRNANGADNNFINQLLTNNNLSNLLGYSAWNTTANTLGSLILSIKIIQNAKSQNTFNQQAFNKLLLTRFLDDWAYQANVRQELKTPDLEILVQKMRHFEKKLYPYFQYNGIINYKFPWNRLFEVEIEFN